MNARVTVLTEYSCDRDILRTNDVARLKARSSRLAQYAAAGITGPAQEVGVDRGHVRLVRVRAALAVVQSAEVICRENARIEPASEGRSSTASSVQVPCGLCWSKALNGVAGR